MDIYQHFRQEEREFIDQVLGWIDQVQEQYAPKLTDFLDPRESEIVRMLIGTNGDVLVSFFGGSEAAERQRALLYPDYYEPQIEDYELTIYELFYSAKFTTLKHRQILGTLMSVGLKREKFGDIWIEGERVQFVVAKDVASYLEMNISKMGNAGVKFQEIPADQAMTVTEQWKECQVTVSSMRIDTILSAIANISRQKSQTLVQQGRVKVNWKQVDNPSYEIRESDVLSTRGIGRMKIFSIEGKTKKDKWKIKCGIQK
ncbi:RNA-binding protein [Bacillus sp. E214]|uniref:YlmH family RNA-binding protein n=1 Tax=Bacillus sp. E214 TaxID=2587156 RepID=UPI0011DFC329|nr:RNA-binding protein [Bacillus sp. E214]